MVGLRRSWWWLLLIPIVIGYIIQYTGNWNLTFYVTAVVYLLGAVCWLLTDPVTPLEEQTAA